MPGASLPKLTSSWLASVVSPVPRSTSASQPLIFAVQGFKSVAIPAITGQLTVVKCLVFVSGTQLPLLPFIAGLCALRLMTRRKTVRDNRSGGTMYVVASLYQ